jgi:hypothetical protein
VLHKLIAEDLPAFEVTNPFEWEVPEFGQHISRSGVLYTKQVGWRL